MLFLIPLSKRLDFIHLIHHKEKWFSLIQMWHYNILIKILIRSHRPVICFNQPKH